MLRFCFALLMFASTDALAQERVILVTGSTGGLGREVAYRLAATGAHVIVHGRNEERGLAVVDSITATGTGSARFIRADLASLDEVRAFAETIRSEYDRLDVLVNNAGILLADGQRQTSADGHELTFAVNYLAGFLLTHELMPLLEASSPSRVVNVSSISQAPIDFDDVMLEDGYNWGRAYSQSKLAQILFTIDLAAELEGTGVSVNAVHPATLMNTDMVEEAGFQPQASVEEGVTAVLQLVNAPDLGSGRYFRGLDPVEAHAQAYDAAARARLRALSVELTGAGG